MNHGSCRERSEGERPDHPYVCGSTSHDFRVGAIVHLPGQCQFEASAEIIQDLRALPWAKCWRTMRNTDGLLFSVTSSTGHVVCGGGEAVWVIELLRRNRALEAAFEHLQKAADAIPYYDDTMRLPHLEDIKGRIDWCIIMNPRPLETALKWGKKKKEEGMTIRLRNIRTNDIIMGDILI